MRINKNTTLCGYPIIQIRDLLRNVKPDDFSKDDVLYLMNISQTEVNRLIKLLENEKLIKKGEYKFNKQFWKVTLKGSTLSLASASKPIRRKTAEKHIGKFLQRVIEVNSNNYYLYKVIKVIVFGSYLSNIDLLTDIDIAVEIKSKINDIEERIEIEQERTHNAANEGRQFINILDRVFWPQREIFLFLKSRLRAISLHTTDDGILEKCDYKIIFEDK